MQATIDETNRRRAKQIAYNEAHNITPTHVSYTHLLQKMGHKPGEYKYLAPNDGVNASQSTNDAYPTAIHLGLYPKGLELSLIHI